MCSYTTSWNIHVKKIAILKDWEQQPAMQDSAT